MLKDIIMIALVVESGISIAIAYKNYKEVKQLKMKINESTGIVNELKIIVDGAGKNISQEIRKQIYNLSWMGIKVK